MAAKHALQSLHGHAHKFVKPVYKSVANLQHEVHRYSCLLGFDHDIVKFHILAVQQRLLHRRGILLNVIDLIDRVGEQITEVDARLLLSGLFVLKDPSDRSRVS